jgi:hypothetical protein
MSTYTLKEESKAWVVTSYENSPMEISGRDIKATRKQTEPLFWIESEDRDDVLRVSSFTQGEAIMNDLSADDSFEDAAEEFEHASIEDGRPIYP